MRERPISQESSGGFVHDCSDCGACHRACPFLERYGSPKDIILTHPGDAFLCTNCGACDTLCPFQLSPSAAFLAAKHSQVQAGIVGDHVRKILASARSFVSTSHGFPFRFYGSHAILFWPGCGLGAGSPELVRRARELLKECMGEDVGLALDCCGDPLYQIGDLDSSMRIIGEIGEALRKAGVTRLITGCVNCQKSLSGRLKDVRVEHILTVIQGLPASSDGGGEIYLHHPCRASAVEKVEEAARSVFSNCPGFLSESLAPMCCGHGGGLTGTDHELSDVFAGRIAESAKGRTLVTYCMGCMGRFLEKGIKVRHILELLTGTGPLTKAPGPFRGWGRRLWLATGERFPGAKLFTGLLLAGAIGVLVYLRLSGYFEFNDIILFLREHPVLAPALFILVYTVAPALFLPAIPLALAAGFLWGPVWGVILSITGATLGASLSFLIARYIMGNAVRARFGRGKWESFTKAVEKHGWKAVAISRLVPVLPFNILNYFFGITPIPFRHYVWCSFVFMLPGCVAFVAFGNSMGDMAKGDLKGLIVGLLVASGAFALPVMCRPLMRRLLGKGF